MQSNFGILLLTTPLSVENITRSVDHCIKALRGAKKIDLFEPARIDPNISIEEQMQTWESLRQAGNFTYIGLSEVKAETIRRANAVRLSFFLFAAHKNSTP